jgi:hypothetical protein
LWIKTAKISRVGVQNEGLLVMECIFGKSNNFFDQLCRLQNGRKKRWRRNKQLERELLPMELMLNINLVRYVEKKRWVFYGKVYNNKKPIETQV